MSFPYAGNYQIGAKASNVCGTSSPTILNVTVNDCGGWFFKVYPNPSSDEVYISESKTAVNRTSEAVTIELYDFMGTKIRQTKHNAGISERKVNVSDLKKGIYFIRIIGKKEDEMHRIIVE